MASQKPSAIKAAENLVEEFIFASRWLQAPVYLGLILGAGCYVYKFFMELWHLLTTVNEVSEVTVMLGMLGLIDISMVMNLLIIVIIGGYTIFTSRIDFGDQEDKPQWLDNMDSGILKIKLASSLASISGVHLLKTFIDIHEDFDANTGFTSVYIEIVIHIVFIVSALLLAWVERILHDSHHSSHGTVEKGSTIVH
jgi:uncharacterized protein (TIGR00645 family)